MRKIVFLDYLTLQSSLKPLEKFGEIVSYDTTKSSEVFSRIEDADIVISNKVALNKEVLQKCKKLQLICIAATGTDKVDLEACKDLGIAVTNVAGYSTASVVEHTFVLYFHLTKHMEYYNNYGKRSWSSSKSPNNLDIPFGELSGKTWGIIGLGNIGKGVAKVAQAFGCKVIYYSTTGKNSDQEYEKVSLEEILSKSDIISVHSPLNKETENLIGYEELSKMKDKVILLNVGRGGIINEKDLSRVLEKGRLAGVGLDVFAQEPPNQEEFFSLDRVAITPHIAWASVPARERLVYEMSQNIEAFFEAKKRNRVDE